MNKTIALLVELDPLQACLGGYILVAVENDLRAKRWVAAHLDYHMAPLGIPDVERVVIHKRQRFLALNIPDFPALVPHYFPNDRSGFGHQDQEQPRLAIVFG